MTIEEIQRFYDNNVNKFPELDDLNDEELCEVVELFHEVYDKGFSKSSDLSNYIRNHRNLMHQFRHISGDLDMHKKIEVDGMEFEDNFIFPGGIGKKYYAIICKLLDLGNNGSDAQAGKFLSYAEKYGWQ